MDIEVPGSNPGQIFLDIFKFLVDRSIRVFQPHSFTPSWFSLGSFIDVAAIVFKPQVI